jgi:hypothetical protein
LGPSTEGQDQSVFGGGAVSQNLRISTQHQVGDLDNRMTGSFHCLGAMPRQTSEYLDVAMEVAVFDYAGMQATERNALVQAVEQLVTLEAVLNWARQLTPVRVIEDILTFDEYSHDVVLRFAENRYLVFDTT